MADGPLRGADIPVTSFGLRYGPPVAPTSAGDRRVRVILFVLWLALFAAGLVFVGRYALTNPFVDEWAFVPVLLGEKPVGPWLWELHNEHRFPLPRLVYIGLFRLTGDLRAGCLVSLIGISLTAAGLMRLARRIRGRASLADAVFPLVLMHVGQGENLYMGYQLAFMLTAALTAGLLAVIVWPAASVGQVSNLSGQVGNLSHNGDAVALAYASGSGSFRRAFVATLLGWLLLACGAAGLAFGVAAAGWVLFLAVFGRLALWRRLALLALIPVTPAYILVYMRGYHRPGHHPPSAGVMESARIGLEAQGMAFGPGAGGLWNLIGDVVLLPLLVVALVVVVQLVRWFFRSHMDPRAVGLFLFVGAAGAVAFGIGWGRSGFHNDMGLAWRYGWITAPAVWGAYFTWLLVGGRVSTYGPAALAIAALLLFPANEGSGLVDAEKTVRPFEAAWEADVRSGRTAAEVFDRHHPDWGEPFRSDAIEAMRLMRARRYTYYESLGAEAP
jgi:hypothetical protein